jgi:hypothetical protein
MRSLAHCITSALRASEQIRACDGLRDPSGRASQGAMGLSTLAGRKVSHDAWPSLLRRNKRAHRTRQRTGGHMVQTQFAEHRVG